MQTAVRVAQQHATAQQHVAARSVPITIAAVADSTAALTGRVKVGGLILLSPFTCIKDVVEKQGIAGKLASKVISKDFFRSIDAVQAITVPLLIIHGTDDSIVPVAHGQQLYEAASVQARELVLVEGEASQHIQGCTEHMVHAGMGHNNIFEGEYYNQVKQAVIDFVDKFSLINWNRAGSPKRSLCDLDWLSAHELLNSWPESQKGRWVVRGTAHC